MTFTQPSRRILALCALTILGGVAAGIVGLCVSWFIHQLVGVSHGHWWAPALGGLAAGLLWWWLQSSRARCAPLADAAIQLLAAGTGLSIGREKAPRQMAAYLTGKAAHTPWTRQGIEPDDYAVLTGAAAGAGLAAVYNVPLAGILFTLTVLRVRLTLRNTAIAATMSALATVIAWPAVGRTPFYVFPGHLHHVWSSRSLTTFVLLAILVVILGWVFGALFRWGAAWADATRPQGSWVLPVSLTAAGLLVGVISIVLPQLPGNGYDILDAAFGTHPIRYDAATVFFALLLLKPLITIACLRAGAIGGVLTPALATGGALGAFLAIDEPLHFIALMALTGAACVLGVAQKAPLFAAVLAWELTGAPLWTLPILIGTACLSWGIDAAVNYMNKRRDTAMMAMPAIKP